LTNLTPDTIYSVQVAAATASIALPDEYFVGPYSPAQEIRTLGEWCFICKYEVTTLDITQDNMY